MISRSFDLGGNVDRIARRPFLFELAAKSTPAHVYCKKTSAAPQKPTDGHKSRASFVDPNVKENAASKAIIDKIYPYFPKQ